MVQPFGGGEEKVPPQKGLYYSKRKREKRNKSALTGSNNVVDNEDLLARLDSILLHLEQVLAVLLDIFSGGTGTGQLALLADGGEGDTETKGQAGAEEEATGIETDDDVGLSREGLGDLQLEGGDEGGVGSRVGEEGHDVDEVDAGNREVGEAAERLAQAYLCTGEFGGGGGGGGGLSSRGILTGSGGVGVVVAALRLLGSHCGEEEKKRRKRGGGGGGRGGKKKIKKRKRE